jgi:RNA polymerase sigma-70 factor (ECF subfamily)
VSKEEVFIFNKMVEGDQGAFKYFFDTYYDDLCNFVNSYIRDETISEDLVQNIFIYLWEKKELLPSDCSIKSRKRSPLLNWIKTILL